MFARRRLGILALLPLLAVAVRSPEVWTVARGGPFEVFSDAGPDAAAALLAGLDRLHAFFAREASAAPDPHRGIRLICFGGRQEYELYRHSAADAYYLGAPDRDYIVLPGCGPGDFHLAAHEYAHLLIRASGAGLPRWMAEGLAEVASTVRMDQRASSIGGDLPARSRVLRTESWLPLPALFGFGEKGAGSAVFYSQSWALTEMLLLSPEYGPRFRLLAASLASGVGGEAALLAVYNRAADRVTRDLRAWVARIPAPVMLGGIGEPSLSASLSRALPVSSFEARAMLADLRLAQGDAVNAEAMYRALAAEPAGKATLAEVYAALGVIALGKGDSAAALAAWEQAMQRGISDAGISYRYAVVADERGFPAALVRRALEQAILLRPDFDDARFKLALMFKNGGQPEAALAQFQAMGAPSARRAFAYHSAVADALLDLGRREEAGVAARQAWEAAASDEERDQAERIRYMAETDLAVQLTSGADGPHFQAIRVPHNQPPRNPFIEPGDGIRRSEATLRNIECDDNGIRIAVSGQSGDLMLAVPDPSRVQIRNSPEVSFEFTCGPQEPRKVLVEYTALKILRGLELR